MSIVMFADAKVGQVYVTQGGLVEDLQGNKIPWGYERVRLIHKDKQNNLFIFATPWGTELSVRGDYIIYDTPEDVVRNEHPMVGNHKGHTVTYIPFDEAVKKGICSIDIPSSPTSQSSDNIRQNIVNYFSTPQKVADAAKHFNLQYPRMRSHLQYIIKNGVNGIQYTAIEDIAEDGKKTIQLIKEK